MTNEENPKQRVCRTCGRRRYLTKFYKDGPRRRRDCKDCVKARLAAWYQKNRETHIARVLKRYRTNKSSARER